MYVWEGCHLTRSDILLSLVFVFVLYRVLFFVFIFTPFFFVAFPLNTFKSFFLTHGEQVHTIATMRVLSHDVFSGVETSASLTAIDIAVSETSHVAPFASVSSAASSRESVYLLRDHRILSELFRGGCTKKTKFREWMQEILDGATTHIFTHVCDRVAKHVDVLGILDLTSKNGADSGNSRERERNERRKAPKWLNSVLDGQTGHQEESKQRPTSVRRGTFWGTYDKASGMMEKERRNKNLRDLRQKQRRGTRQRFVRRVEEVSIDESRGRSLRRSSPTRPARRNSRAFLP